MTIHPALSPMAHNHGKHHHSDKTTTSSEAADTVKNQTTTHENSGKVSVSVQLSVSFSYQSANYTPAINHTQSLTYDKPTNAEVKNVGPSTAVSSAERTEAANNIMSFINQRLALDSTEGATAEELQSRLKAGMEGFIKGYTEAFKQLNAMGTLLTPEAQNAIEQTYHDVLQGIAELAEEYGLENPAAELMKAPAPTFTVTPIAEQNASTNKNTLNALFSPTATTQPKTHNQDVNNLKQLLDSSERFYTTLNAQREDQRDYSFTLKTADGDTVTINAASKFSEYYQSSQNTSESSQLQARHGSTSETRFGFSVEGDLDADELKAINNLLTQINDVADSFFAGDIQGAFEQALSVGYDSDEIVSFALHLTHVQTTRIETTYGQVANASNEGLLTQPQERISTDNRVDRMAEFIRQLEAMRLESEALGIQGRPLHELMQFVGRERFTQHPDVDAFGRVTQNMISALEKIPN